MARSDQGEPGHPGNHRIRPQARETGRRPHRRGKERQPLCPLPKGRGVLPRKHHRRRDAGTVEAGLPRPSATKLPPSGSAHLVETHSGEPILRPEGHDDDRLLEPGLPDPFRHDGRVDPNRHGGGDRPDRGLSHGHPEPGLLFRDRRPDRRNRTGPGCGYPRAERPSSSCPGNGRSPRGGSSRGTAPSSTRFQRSTGAASSRNPPG